MKKILLFMSNLTSVVLVIFFVLNQHYQAVLAVIVITTIGNLLIYVGPQILDIIESERKDRRSQEETRAYLDEAAGYRDDVR